MHPPPEAEQPTEQWMAHHVGVAEQSGGRVAHHLLGNPVVRIGVVATGPELMLAEEAVSAGDGEWNHRLN